MKHLSQKLELKWHGKDNWESPEPRLLVEKEVYQSDKKGIDDNLLIYGDNLLGLKALERDYTGKIKCIYIDPPYNTKSCFKNYNDNLEHSRWLNMIKGRLAIMHGLLREDGSIWISIDDTEMHYLKIICDEIFGRSNYVATLPTIMNLKGNQDQFGFAGIHEYTLVYARKKSILKLNHFSVDEEEMLANWESDEFGYFKKADTLRRTGQDAPRKNRPKGWFPIFITPEDEIYVSQNDKPKNSRDLTLWPINSNGDELSWTWGKEKISNESHNLIVTKGREGKNIYKKQRPQMGDLPTKKPKSILYKPEYSTGHGTNQIKKLFGSRSFDYPKSEYLIYDIILLATNPGDLVLDSFAGSGTTGAVAHKMGRRWIMIELGEHCHTHIIPRLEKVIEGKDPGGITEQAGWEGGGGFRYCEMAPSLLEKNRLGRWTINKQYNPAMLAEAVCLHAGYEYAPKRDPYWMHGHSTERDFIYVTARILTKTELANISAEVGDDRSLIIYCEAFTTNGIDFENLTVRNILENDFE